MQQSIYYNRYALHFADKQITELVNIFNSQVVSRGWTSMRACHNQALIDEFRRRHIDTTAISDGRAVSFAHPILYDMTSNRLVRVR